MKVLHVLSSTKLSGAENVVADICMMFEGVYKMVYCSPNGPISDSLQARSVKYISLKRFGIKEITRVIKEYKPDLIHAHDSRASVMIALLSFGIPVVSQLHGNHENMRKITVKSLLYLLLSFRINRIIAVSPSCIDDYVFKRFVKHKTIILPNVIHYNRIELLVNNDCNSYDFDFVFLGRLSYPKNPERVARVAAEILKKNPNANFGVIGEGELKDKMVNVFNEKGVSDRVIFTGRLSFPYKALKSARCMLMCSRYEGLPIAALEAMALGIPIVSTPVDGMKLIVDHEKTGFLSEFDEKLVGFVGKLISDDDLFTEISEASKRKFTNLNSEQNYKDVLSKVYQDIIVK